MAASVWHAGTLSAVPGTSFQDLNNVGIQSFKQIPNSHITAPVGGTCRRPSSETHKHGPRLPMGPGAPVSDLLRSPHLSLQVSPTQDPPTASRPRLLTKNSGSPNGEKSIALTLTGLGPRSRGWKHLGGILRPCLAPWPMTPWQEGQQSPGHRAWPSRASEISVTQARSKLSSHDGVCQAAPGKKSVLQEGGQNTPHQVCADDKATRVCRQEFDAQRLGGPPASIASAGKAGKHSRDPQAGL